MANKNSLSRYIVGAYATSPNLVTWDEKSELTYFNELKKLPSIRGLELPFWGESLHPFDDEWLLSNLDPKWENVLTCVPGTMRRLDNDPYFGLASIKKNSRIEAIKFYSKALECVKILNNHFDVNKVLAVQTTSAPTNTQGNLYAHKKLLFESLSEIVSWDWFGSKIVIEHFDAAYEYNPIPKKGFLTLEEEIDTIIEINEKYDSNCGIVINWGRSVIEFKNVEGPIKHIKDAIQHNVLCGLMFSGTSDNDNNLYGAWSDLHMPPADYLDFQYFESESLMSFENIKNTLLACDYNALDYLGIKLLAMPDESTIEKRIGINKDAMILLDHTIKEIERDI